MLLNRVPVNCKWGYRQAILKRGHKIIALSNQSQHSLPGLVLIVELSIYIDSLSFS